MENLEKPDLMAKPHHQWTGPSQSYVCFQVKCQTCGMLLFEFVHKQEYLNSQERIMAIPDPRPPMGAQSWYKPAVRVVHRDDTNGISHEFESARVGQDKNQVVTSVPWTRAQFDAWSSTI